MKGILKILMLCLLISSCCREDSVETARYGLKAEELALIPYQNGEKKNFVHSNGYSFDLNVIEDTLEWKEYHSFCEWNCCGNDYFSYQVKTSILESTYPRFHIELSLGGTKFSDYYPQVLSVEINNRHFIQFPYDTLANFICDSITKAVYYDSISLNNKMYYEVVKRDFDRHNFINDSSVLVPMSMYLNHLGIIQLKMSNYETYTRND